MAWSKIFATDPSIIQAVRKKYWYRKKLEVLNGKNKEDRERTCQERY